MYIQLEYMKLVLEPDPDMAGWLYKWSEAPSFDWDKGNLRKLKKHGLIRSQVEELAEDFVFAGRIARPDLKESRWELIGTDRNGDCLAMTFTIRNGRLRPISCRPAHTMEKTVYREVKFL
ncbi:MAG: BrnT family toxin [Bradymonadales bacterium]|nr:MAG: BrnT family toxin [Bradymonadales bacterium]